MNKRAFLLLLSLPVILLAQEAPLPSSAEDPGIYQKTPENSSTATTIPWQKGSYTHFAKNEPLANLIRDFCAAQNVKVIISQEVEDKKYRVNGDFDEQQPQDFLNQVTRAYGLAWFYDGNILYIDTNDSISSTMLELTDSRSAKRLRHILDQLGFVSSDFSIKILEEEGIMFASGTPRFIEMLEELTQIEGKTRKRLRNEITVEVFPLNHAWAYDVNIGYRGGTITVPGVATILQEIMGLRGGSDGQISMGSNSPQAVSGRYQTLASAANASSDARSAQITTGILDTAERTLNVRQAEQAIRARQNGQDPDGEQLAYNVSPIEPLIRPDVRHNAIVIRDSKDQMPIYEDIIRLLDRPAEIISISAAIIEVDTTFSQSLGLRYFDVNKSGKYRGTVGTGSAVNSFTEGAVTTDYNISGKIIKHGAELLFQIQSLEEDGLGKLLDRSSVVTFPNMEAVISRDQTFYVKLVGERDVDLFNVNSGTSFKVVPSIINSDEEGERQIRLLINIHDGSNTVGTNTLVEDIPVVNDIFINTQAVVKENHSLLIGGFYRKTKTNNDNGVPLLKRVPLLGLAFKSKTKATQTLERIFVITPTILRLEDLNPDHFDEHFEPGPLTYGMYKSHRREEKEAIEKKIIERRRARISEGAYSRAHGRQSHRRHHQHGKMDDDTSEAITASTKATNPAAESTPSSDPGTQLATAAEEAEGVIESVQVSKEEFEATPISQTTVVYPAGLSPEDIAALKAAHSHRRERNYSQAPAASQNFRWRDMGISQDPLDKLIEEEAKARAEETEQEKTTKTARSSRRNRRSSWFKKG